MASTKRMVLNTLKRKRLLEIADGEAVELPERRALDPILVALSRKHSLSLESILGYLSRDELKAACREFGLDGGGRAKGEIVKRILDGRGGPRRASSRAAGKKEKRSAKKKTHSLVSGKTLADYPELVAQWHPTKNGDLKPRLVTAGSSKKVWWKCPAGSDHEWKAPPKSRTRMGAGCPCCSGRKASATNSIASLFKEVSAQWHPTLNRGLTPEQVAAGSHKKYWWKCPLGPDHDWEASPKARTLAGSGCPFCAGKGTSVTNSLASLHPEIALQWHPKKNGDTTPDLVMAGSHKRYWWKCPEGPDHAWRASPAARIAGSGCLACVGKQVSVTNSLASQFPEIAAQWHPTKNGDFKPDQVVAGSKKKCWWVCPDGPDHEWLATVKSRAVAGCPACAGRQASVTNSLAAQFPEIAAQWHPTKNGDLTPDQVVAGSGKKPWWICPHGPDHEWRSTVVSRTRSGAGCPACFGRQASVTNSLARHFPAMAGQWHPTRNGELTPADVPSGSLRKYWWACPEGADHVWLATVVKRTMQGTGCPFCAGHKVSATNSLVGQFPEIAAQWHSTKNGELTPDSVVSGSSQKRWWVCAKAPDHVWQTTVASRTRSGTGCPSCSGRQSSTTNSLARLYPRIAAQWHPTKNGDITPFQVPSGSSKKYWWLCSQGEDHKWFGSIANRVKGRGCPACAGHQVSVTNSLARQFPEVASQWHPTKNGDITPDQVVSGSAKRYWWECPVSSIHAWQASVANRTRLGSGCPACGSGWTVQTVRSFVESLLPHLDSLTPAELYLLFQQSGVLSTQGVSKGFVKALATGRFPHDELEKWVKGEEALPDQFLANPDMALEDHDVREDDEVGVLDPESQLEGEETQAELPVVQVREALAALEHGIAASYDEEAMEFLLASAKTKLWRRAYQPATEDEAIEEARAYAGGEYALRVRDQFLSEYEAAINLSSPKGYAFTVEGRITQPNLMQRLVAVRVRDSKRFGNWSGTGAGKTLSAVLSTRVVAAKLTVICCPNAVVQGWTNEIEGIFPGSEVVAKTWEPTWKGRGPRYLIQNFEQFQQRDSEGKLKTFLNRHTVDFVVIDEIHYAKQRKLEAMSRRKRLVMGLVAAAAEANTDLCVLGMSATPVINNLQEGRSLVELVTGVEHEDLETRATVPNCMRLHQELVRLGTRYMPDYDAELDVQIVEVDCSDHVDEIRALGKGHSPLELEKILTRVRLPVILEHLQKGAQTLLYTHYREGIDKILYDAIRDRGLTVGFCTGVDKTGLEPFKRGKLDVLIGSSSIGTGVDGLQHVCDKLVINVLPWTNAEFEQLKGRIWRQGQRSSKVTVIVPVTQAEVNGEVWSYCRSKLNRLQYKKSVADAAVDGVVPEGNLRSPAQAQRDLMAWLDRLAEGEAEPMVRRKIVVPLSDGDAKDVKRRQRRYGDFSTMNGRWNSTGSEKLHERLAKAPEEWEQYHTLYRQARKTWTVVPFEEVVRWCDKREGLVIGDFGCGEALLARGVSDRHVVHSFDHIAINDTVIAGDMSHTGLEDGSLDVAVFSLSLMGANFTDFLREAWRTLKLDGRLLLWEATSRFDDSRRFARDMVSVGFDVSRVEEKAQFTQIQAIKADRNPEPGFLLRFREAPPAAVSAKSAGRRRGSPNIRQPTQLLEQADHEGGTLAQVLGVLKRRALHRIADGEGVDLPDRKTLAGARDALLAAIVEAEAVLSHLTRAELDAVGREFGVTSAARSNSERREQIIVALEVGE